MDKQQLDAIKARCQAATPGPWIIESTPLCFHVVSEDGSFQTGCLTLRLATKPQDNAEFIANARDDVPALVAEVERLRAALEKYADYSNWNLCLSSGDDTGPLPDEWIAENEGEERGPAIARKALNG